MISLQGASQAFIEAVKKGNRGQIAMFLAKHPNLSVSDKAIDKALEIAKEKGLSEIVILLEKYRKEKEIQVSFLEDSFSDSDDEEDYKTDTKVNKLSNYLSKTSFFDD